MALYLMGVYGNTKTEEWFRSAYKASSKKLDMGKSCVRFKKLDDLPLNVIGEVILCTSAKAFIEAYEMARKRK